VRLQWHLGAEDFFRDLPTEKSEFLARAVRRSLKKSAPIFTENDPASSCFYLEAGVVKISRLAIQGKEPIIFLRRAGEVFGLAEIIDGNQRICNAEAISATILYEIRRRDFEDLLARHYPLARRVIQVLGRRGRYLAAQIENLMVCDVATRLLKLFLYLSYPLLVEANSGGEPIAVPVNLTQEQLAACTGSCQQTVSETLKLLQEEGLIRVSQKQVFIIRPLDIMDRILQ
jgi:CRP/FNR family transcriptional regulator, cyclic AMP receptor protein